jgi:hypothetical protein
MFWTARGIEVIKSVWTHGSGKDHFLPREYTLKKFAIVSVLECNATTTTK